MFEWFRKRQGAKEVKAVKLPIPKRSFWEVIDEGTLRLLVEQTGPYVLGSSTKAELLYGALSEAEARLLDSALAELLMMLVLMESGYQLIFCRAGNKINYVPAWAKYPLRLTRVRNLLEDGLEDDLAAASALDEDMLEYLTVMW